MDILAKFCATQWVETSSTGHPCWIASNLKSMLLIRQLLQLAAGNIGVY